MVQVVNQPQTTAAPADEQVNAITIQAKMMTEWREGTDMMLSHIGTHLGQVYDAAEQSGDVGTMQSTSEAWQQAQQLGDQAKNAIGAFLGVAAIIDPIVVQRNVAVKELSELTRAVKHADSNHHLVGDLIEIVAEDAEGNALDYFGEVTNDNLLFNAQEYLGMDVDAAASLVNCLFSDETPSRADVISWIDALTALRDSLEADAS